MDELLQKVKDNLILSHDEDDELLRGYIRAAVSYAESYQHIPSGHYADNPMPPTTEQAVIIIFLAAFWTEHMYTPFHESVIRDQQTSAVADVIEQVLLRDALYAEGAFRQTSGVELRH